MDFSFTEKQKQLRQSVRQFAKEQLGPIASEVDASYELHKQALDLVKKSGLFAYVVPEEFGGKGISSINICIIREELAQVCLFADEAVVMQGLGGDPIVKYGTQAQKERYLPPLVDGSNLINFCLTEPEAGSDVAGMQSTAKLHGDNYILNGRKCYVSKPNETDVSVVFAKTDLDKGSKGISAFIVEKALTPYKVNMNRLIFECPIGEIVMDNLKVPRSNLLGEEGQGMRIALGNLDIFRPTVGACALGMARSALRLAFEHATNRKMFGQRLIDFQASAFKLAEMKAEIDAAELLVYRAAWLADTKKGITTMESSVAKYYATEMANRVIDKSLQMHGGMGLNKRSRIELLYRAARASRIYEGASEIQLHVIARNLIKHQDFCHDDRL